MNKEFNGFDEMVEALEENEDMVECKECFDLVPKVECERAEVGYICPTCKGLRTAPTQARFVDPYDSYTQDFPEVTDYDPDSVVDYEKEPGLGDALDDLIKDEYEAIEGYEVADETIQHADIPEDEKDEILDTLDHIKEEEEEHIDELKELCPECGDPEKEDTQENLTESAGEPKIYYIYADDGYIDDLGYMEAMDINEVIREAEIRYSDRFHPEDLYVEEAEPESLVDLVPSDFIIPPKHFKFNEALTEAEPEKLEEKLPREPQVYDDNGNLIKVKDPEILKIWNKVMDQAEADGITSWSDYATQKQIIDKALTPEEIEKLKKVEFEDGSIRAAYESLTEDAEEEVEEIPEEESPEEEAEESEENENEEVSDLDSAYEAALEIANESGVGQVFGYARKETEEFVAIEPFEVDDPEAVEDDLMAVYDDVAYAYVAYPEESLEESLFEDVQLNEGPGKLLKGIGRKMSNTAQHLANRKSGKLLDKFFTNGYIIVLEGPKPKDNLDAYKQLHKSEWSSLEEALNEAYYGSQDFPQHRVWVFAKPLDEANLTPRERTLAKASNGLGPTITGFTNGKADVKRDKELADAIQKIEIDKKDRQRVTGKSGSTNRDPRDFLGNDEEEEGAEADITGEKPAEKSAVEDPADEDPNLDDDEDPRDKAKQMLGEKKDPNDYTPESYKKYAAAYAKILAWIEAHKKPEALIQERIDNLKKQAEDKLKAAPKDDDKDPDLSDDEEDTGNTTPEAPADTDTGSEDTASGEEDKPTDEAEEAPTEENTESVGKLSEVSEEQLKKLFTAVTGQGVGDNNKWQKVLKRMRAKLQELGESLDPSDYKPEDFIEEELQSEADAVKSLKDTEATLKATVDGIKNMTSAMKESILNLSPADFAECVDSSRVELWGLEEPEDGVASAVLIKSYDDVANEDVQACHDEMLDLDGMFTFCFTASGKPSLWGWNAEQLREFSRAGIKGISFDDPAYEEAISLAWHIK